MAYFDQKPSQMTEGLAERITAAVRAHEGFDVLDLSPLGVSPLG